MNIFELNRAFWDFAFSNPEKIKPNHCAIYYFALEHCNRLGWKQKFGFPTSMVLEATGIKSYSVYKKTFDELVEYGFFEVIEYSKNQYSSNIIALKENYKAHIKALDNAFIKHSSKQDESVIESTYSIDIPINNEPKTKEQIVLSDFEKAFEDFRSMRKQIKKPITLRAEELLLLKLQKMCGSDEVLKIKLLNQSIINCWQDIYDIKIPKQPQNKIDTPDISKIEKY